MRTARYAAFVAGAVCLHGMGVFAGEGSSLRGLKPPSNAFVGPATLYPWLGEAGFRRSADDIPLDLVPRLFLSGVTTEARRVTTSDADFRFALHQPLGQNIPALAEPNIHTLHDVLPRYTLQSQVTRNLAGGWGVGFGIRQTEYNFTSTNLLSLSAERQWGSVRGAYTFMNRAEGLGLSGAHRFELSYLYGERNTIGLAYSTGREIDNVAFAAGLPLMDARDWTLSGRHWLSPNWALTYDLLSEQGSLPRRPGLRLGVSRSF